MDQLRLSKCCSFRFTVSKSQRHISNKWRHEQGLEGRLNKAASPAERDGEEIWVPLRHVHYREGPQDQTPPTSDAADAKSLINDHREAEEKTSMSEPLL
ncbi:TPA: pol protein-like [Bos taurus]|nr:TPA: pol protein-like [Bos taurus]